MNILHSEGSCLFRTSEISMNTEYDILYMEIKHHINVMIILYLTILIKFTYGNKTSNKGNDITLYNYFMFTFINITNAQKTSNKCNVTDFIYGSDETWKFLLFTTILLSYKYRTFC